METSADSFSLLQVMANECYKVSMCVVCLVPVAIGYLQLLLATLLLLLATYCCYWLPTVAIGYYCCYWLPYCCYWLPTVAIGYLLLLLATYCCYWLPYCCYWLPYCLQMGQFYYAAKAFDVLEKLDPNPEYWEGKRGACIGQFQLVVAGRESRLVVHVYAVRVDCACTQGHGWTVHAHKVTGGLCMHTRSRVDCACTQGHGWTVHAHKVTGECLFPCKRLQGHSA